MQYLGLGAEIAASLLIPILLGYFLDDLFKTSPIFILIGVAGAMIGFGFMIFRISKKLDSDDF
ncbi:MAG: AtpZ/AtpI family protein [Gracilimonas sp.]|jgi:F0F1-type ATP synthase assembly protein I|nr:AtpZ/AtpI family protein [Gracilimonas sp.]